MKTIEQIALEEVRSGFGCRQNDEADHVQFAKSVLEAYLAEHSKPVVWRHRFSLQEKWFYDEERWRCWENQPLYLAPQPAVPADVNIPKPCPRCAELGKKYSDVDAYIEEWKESFAVVLNDYNKFKNRSESLEKALVVAESALETLAKLGNGDCYGNSHGNTIAQEALTKIKEVKG